MVSKQNNTRVFANSASDATESDERIERPRLKDIAGDNFEY